jgi:hypothetical protein
MAMLKRKSAPKMKSLRRKRKPSRPFAASTNAVATKQIVGGLEELARAIVTRDYSQIALMMKTMREFDDLLVDLQNRIEKIEKGFRL